MSTDLTPNHPVTFESCQAYLVSLFRPGDHIEFRALRDRRDQHKVHTLYRAAPITDSDESLVDWLHAHNAPGWSLYVGPNPRHSGRGSGAAGASNDGDVVVARSLFVDFDDADPSEATIRIESAGLPAPTLLISSGRATGTHAYWVFGEAIEDLALWRRLQISLIRAVQSDPAIKNPSRIMRLPGTENHKRGAPCRILRVGNTFTNWGELGIEPEAEFAAFAAEYDPDRKPCEANLNRVTIAFLDEDTPEGERNNRLVAAAFDYNANNFPIEQAIQDLAIERAVNRDGLTEGEAVRTVQSAYRRKATPSYSRTVVEEYSAADLTSFLNTDRGMAPKDFDPGADTAVATKIVGELPSSEGAPPVEGSTTEKSPVKRVDHRPTEASDRVLVANVSTKVVMDNGRRKVVTLYKSVDDIARDMNEALGGFPRRSKATGVFAVKETRKGDVELWPILDTNDLFALLHDRAIVRWVRGECETETGDTLSSITKAEFYKWVKDNCEPSYDAVSEYPHIPSMPSTYYLPVELPEPTGEALNEFIAALNPETEADRMLMLAAMMTPGWGGPPGARPMFVFASDYGQGSGKTETAKAIGRIWGGSATLDYEDNWQNVSKRIMSSDDWLSRVFLFDNVKGKFGGSAIEAAVTSEYLTGHKMFVGTVKRPNDATFMLTFNMPEMTRDLAQRAVIIKVGKPKMGDFVEWAADFVREHKKQLISDLLDLLRKPAEEAISPQNKDRWQAWQRDVLSKVPGCDPDALATKIIERRPGADGDAEEACEIVQAIGSYLSNQERRAKGVAISEVTGAEIVNVMEATGNWVNNDSYSKSSNMRKCMSIVKGKLLGRGVLMPVEVESEEGKKRAKKVRVNDQGRPTGQRGGSQSIVYGWVWERADEVLGIVSGEEDSHLMGDSGYNDLPI